MSEPTEITVTELHADAGGFVERASRGELFIITVGGWPKALIGPLPPDFDRSRRRKKRTEEGGEPAKT